MGDIYQESIKFFDIKDELVIETQLDELIHDSDQEDSVKETDQDSSDSESEESGKRTPPKISNQTFSSQSVKSILKSKGSRTDNGYGAKHVRFLNADKKTEENLIMQKDMLTDTSHNDLALLHNVLVHTYFQMEDSNAAYVLYLREKNLVQENLLKEQSDTITSNENNSNKEGEEELNKIVVDVGKKFKGLESYKNGFKIDFSTSFKVDFPNFCFNMIILVLMSVQMFQYIYLDGAILRQNWEANLDFSQDRQFKLEDINTYLAERLQTNDGVKSVTQSMQIVGQKVDQTSLPQNVKDNLEYVDNPKWGETKGKVTTYGTTGY